MTDPADRLRGRLIAFEGIDGSGKSTQIHLVKRWLEMRGARVFLYEWDNSPLVRNTTSRVRNRELLTPTTYALLHATDFADRYDRQVLPLLRAGYIVLCDCYFYAAFARDVVRGCMPDWVRGLYEFATHAHLTFFFRAPLEVCLNRIRTDRLELKYFEAGMDLRLSPDFLENFRLFQARLLEQYLLMSTQYGFRVVDATEPIETQQQVVRRILESFVEPSPVAPIRS